MEEKCYFHPEWPSKRECLSCKRSFCKACIGATGQCFACRAIKLSKKGENKEVLEIDTMKIKNFEFSEKGFKYSIPQVWIGNWKDKNFKLFPFLITQYFSLPLSGEKVEIYYTGPNQVISIWSQGERKNENGVEIEVEKPTLLFSAVRVRFFTGLIGKIWNFFKYFLLPLFIFGCLGNLLLYFFRNSPAINWLSMAGTILFLIAIYLFGKLFIKSISPSLWSPEPLEITGEVETNLLPPFGFPDGYLNWSRNKEGMIPLLGWQIFLRVITKDNKKIRVLIEGSDEKPTIQIPEEGKRYKFIGRELYNVLICNLDLKDSVTPEGS